MQSEGNRYAINDAVRISGRGQMNESSRSEKRPHCRQNNACILEHFYQEAGREPAGRRLHEGGNVAAQHSSAACELGSRQSWSSRRRALGVLGGIFLII